MLSRVNRFNYIVLSYCGVWQHVFFQSASVIILIYAFKILNLDLSVCSVCVECSAACD